MGKKKREHIVFDQMLKPKKSIPFNNLNISTKKLRDKKIIVNKINAKS